MLTHPTLDQLRALKLDGMAAGFRRARTARGDPRPGACRMVGAAARPRGRQSQHPPLQRRDLMEIVEDRHGRGSILITSQLPVATWHEVIGEPTVGDAILDRIVHNAYRLELDGPSMRKIKAAEAIEPPAQPATPTAADGKPSKEAKK